MPRVLEERFLAKFRHGTTEECWLWQGVRDSKGYGRLHVPAVGRKMPVHRIAYVLAFGAIPEGHVIHHTCKTRSCVNPAHLESLPAAEHNSLPHPRKQPTRCSRGHELTPENLRIRPGSMGGRRFECRICCAAYAREAYRRRRLA